MPMQKLSEIEQKLKKEHIDIKSRLNYRVVKL